MPVTVTLGRDAAVRTAVAAAAVHLPAHPYRLVPIASLTEAAPESRVDVMAVVATISAPKPYVRKSDGQPGCKRVLEVCDDSGGPGASTGVRVTLFVNEDEPRGLAVGAVVALRATVELWNGSTNLSVGHGGLVCDPAMPEAARLAAWWRTELQAPTLLAPRWNFVAIDALRDRPEGARVDVVGCIVNVQVRERRRRARIRHFRLGRDTRACIAPTTSVLVRYPRG